ncbi:MAG TPA: hypothetical protein VNN10_13010 [Dehalococcoidia bacterium]|nr:hypothetical protein [Dehalococcoidia bacterium]
MPSDQVEQIKDGELRDLMARASTALDEGKNYDCVRLCADAYLLLLKKNEAVMQGLKRVIETPRVKAGLEREMIRFAPLMWPRMAAKLHLEGPEPEIVFDRQHLGFGEAIQYYEFTLNLIVTAEEGKLEQQMQAALGGGLA